MGSFCHPLPPAIGVGPRANKGEISLPVLLDPGKLASQLKYSSSKEDWGGCGRTGVTPAKAFATCCHSKEMLG